jgi:ketosteroid isomerase-like protein
MKKILFIVLLSISSQAYAQSVTEEINKQVWNVLIDAYNSFNTDKFMSVYAKDVVRIPLDEKKILDFNEYRKNINRENQFNKNYKIKAKIEFRFTERIHTDNLAFERGIFKINITDNNSKPAVIYSRFQALLRKEAGVWKIQFDSDSAEKSTLTEKEFMEASPL